MSILTKENAPAGTKGADQRKHGHCIGAPSSARPNCGLYPRPGLPIDWRRRLPEPEAYYRSHVAKMGRANRSSWAQGRCPFHEDHEASLSVNLEHGGWRCFAGCGQGDLLAFHMRLTGRRFVDAVAELTGVEP